MPGDDDVRILEACLGNRPGGWKAFVDRFAPPLAAICRRVLQRAGRPAGQSEVDDMLQAVFLVFLQHDKRVLRGYQGKGNVEAYLAAVAVRTVLADRSLTPLPQADRPEPQAGPAELAEARETQALIRQEMALLPPRTQLALSLQARGYTLKEIGNAMGLSVEAVGQILSRAKAQLRERLKS